MSLARLIECEDGCALLLLLLTVWNVAVLTHGGAGVHARLGARCGKCHCLSGVHPCCRTEQWWMGERRRGTFPIRCIGAAGNPSVGFADSSLCRKSDGKE